MNKKIYAVIGIAALLLITGSVVLVAKHNHKTTTKLASCTLKDDRKNLDLSADELKYIELSAMDIANIPAGTNVDINLKSFNGSIVKGSTIYAGNYGSYNFTLRKDMNGSRINWTVLSLVPCKR